MTTVHDVVKSVESIYPTRFAMRDDRIGLMVGSASRVVRSLVVALDPDVPAVDAARKEGADLIVSHHPIWWKAPKTLLAHEASGRGAIAAAACGISVIAAHTNADFAPGGLCDALCSMLGVVDPVPLVLDGEALVGRSGAVKKPIPAAQWLQSLRRRFGPGVRSCGLPPRNISRIAVCSGSGSDLLGAAFASGTDALVTGDVKYHAARDAEELARSRRAEVGATGGFLLVDAGHFATERIFVPRTVKKLKALLPGVKVRGFLEKEPFRR